MSPSGTSIAFYRSGSFCYDLQLFEINIEPAVLDDLRDRLRGTRWPDEIDGAGWTMA